MNYLTHIFLSGTDRKIQFGNFIGDAVKGSSYKHYPQAIADGILLHRAIDSYTDNHATVRSAVQLLRPYSGRYSGVLIDIFFDYLLASRFDEFSGVSLKQFARSFYLTMVYNYRYMPDRFRRFMWHFIGTNRLVKYATKDGIRESVGIMTRVGRIKFPVGEAIDYLTECEDELRMIFRPFFGELQVFCTGYLHSENREAYVKQM